MRALKIIVQLKLKVNYYKRILLISLSSKYKTVNNTVTIVTLMAKVIKII